MTDFVAVIRRAVDGLKDNNPEMRAKVYEKARSAVLKQLENMKPQPTADVIARQMAKLDAAVISVENEHADAIPEDFAPVEEQIYAPEPAPDDSWEGEQHPELLRGTCRATGDLCCTGRTAISGSSPASI